MYKIIRNLLFTLPPEKAHKLSMSLLKLGFSLPMIKPWTEDSFIFKSSSLSKEVFGLNFRNPVGLGAGFDKNASYLNELESLGFGFIEIGTVTPKYQSGNESPRLFRLPKDCALINRMGFNNDGVYCVKDNIYKWRNKTSSNLIVGGNIGKNKVTENVDAWKDYNFCFNELFDLVDYFVVNVSSPNTPGLRDLQSKNMLSKILCEVQDSNYSKGKKPLLLKISPDLTEHQINDIINVTIDCSLDGLIVSNTTIDRNNLITNINEEGGLSGKPLKIKSNDMIMKINKQIPHVPIIGSGGIFSGKDAKDKIDAGSDLIQIWTGFIYEGPGLLKDIFNVLLS